MIANYSPLPTASLEEFCAGPDRFYYRRWYSGGRFGIVQDPVRGILYLLYKFSHLNAYAAVVVSGGGYDEPMEKTANPYLYDPYSNHELIPFETVCIIVN